MKETEIRDRLQGAFGESNYPPDLTHRIASRLDEPPRPRGQSQLIGVVAVILALAIIGTLLVVRMQSVSLPLPAITPPVEMSPQSPPLAVRGSIPQADLDRAQLSNAGDLVTQLNLTSTSNGRTVTLIGAYADHARTALFFRTMPDGGSPNATIYDDSGFLNGASTAGPGIVGDSFFVLEMGPHPGSDGVAHVKVVIGGFNSAGRSGLQNETGNWMFSFPLNVAASNTLSLNPPLTSVGSWKVSVEAMEVTSTLIHFQAVFDGAAVEDFQQATINLLDASGHPARNVSWEAGTTVPKSQITSIPPRNTRVNITWVRPASAGDYVLAIAGGGSEYRGTVHIPGPATPTPRKGGSVFLPTIYPSAVESLRLEGAFSAAIFTGNPSACGQGSGPDGINIYAFGLWFQTDQIWYLMTFDTDKAVGPYKGPGTYPVKASIYPYVAANGIGDPIFTGTVQLTVTDDKFPGPQTGTVQGTVTWTGAATQQYTVNVSGSWTCMFSTETGPA